MAKRKPPIASSAASGPPPSSAIPTGAAVLAAIKKNQPRPVSHLELLRYFQLDQPQEKAFKKLMKSLVRQGAMERLKGKRYLLPGPDMVLAEAATPKKESTGKGEIKTATGGESDTTTHETTAKDPKVSENKERIRAKLLKQGHFYFAVPIADPGEKPRPKGTKSKAERILIPRKHMGKAKPGDLIMVQILEPATRTHEAVGKIISGMRRESDFGEVSHQFFREFKLSKSYPRRPLEEASDLPAPTYTGEHGREDLRNLYIITIDPSTARDHDDAISLEKIEGGNWRLGVHIADVSEYVSADSALDHEALRRSFTQYLPWVAVPMLPERLSADLCSLREGCERLAFSCFMEVNAKGQMKGFRFAETFIRVTKFYSYEEAQQAKENGDPHLTLIDTFATLRQAVRKEEGNLEFAFPEPRVTCDADGVPVDIYPGVRLASHSWIEECMLLCNQAAAKYLTKNKLPGLFRVHEQPDLDVVSELFVTQGGSKPDPELMKAFSELTETKGYLNPAVQKFYARLLSQENGPLPASVQRKVLRSMKKALYAPEALGHFALGWLHYAHFTSPIRRYADLWIHRVMKAHLRGKKKFAAEKQQAESIAEQISGREIDIMKTERKGMKTATAWVLQKHIGQEFTATITGVEEFGLFVAITNPYGEGMVPVARLGDDFYIKDESTYSLVGRRSKHRFTLGQTLEVRLTRSNPFSGQVDFEPVVRTK
jgi:ribonuclease R